MNQNCPEPDLCQAGAQCAGRCRPNMYTMQLAPAGYGMSQHAPPVRWQGWAPWRTAEAEQQERQG